MEEVVPGEDRRGEATSAVEWMAVRSEVARWEADLWGVEESAITSRVEAMAAVGIWVVVTGVEAIGEAAVTGATTGAATIVAGAVGEAGVMLRAGVWDWALVMGWATTTDGDGAGVRPIIIPPPPTDTR